MIIITINNQIINMKKLPFALLAFCFGAVLTSAKDYKITQNDNFYAFDELRYISPFDHIELNKNEDFKFLYQNEWDII